MKSQLFLVSLLLASTFASADFAAAQAPVPETTQKPVAPAGQTPVAPPATTEVRNYILGPDDLLMLMANDVDELNKAVIRVGLSGDVTLPLIGLVHVGGLTVEEFQAEIRKRLVKFVLHPDVVVTLTEYHSQPVSVLGQLNQPGVFQLQGHKTLEEVLSMAGGLDPLAGSTLSITRQLKWGELPLPDAKTDPTGRFSIGTVNLKDLTTAAIPADNIQIMPDDVISVVKETQVYVLGSVIKPGAIQLGQEQYMTALQALAEAWGLGKGASPGKARLMRLVPGTSGQRTETPVDLKRLLAGKIPDIQLQANDILFVPSSLPKSVASAIGQGAVQGGTAIAIGVK